MYKFILSITVAFMLCACGSESGNAVSGSQAKAETSPSGKSSGKKREQKWEINIEGLSEQSGRNITAVTMGINGRYTVASSGFVGSVSIVEGESKPDMIFTFDEENVRCFNDGGVMISIDHDRAILSGTVQCMPKGSGGERTGAKINGWISLKKK